MLNTLFKYRLVLLFAAVGILSNCSEDDAGSQQGDYASNKILIGGVDTAEMLTATVTSRAEGKPAETESWLVQPLKSGLDITYGLYGADDKKEDVAILKLSTEKGGNPYDVENGLAVYTFRYRTDQSSLVGSTNDAIWYNNGYHYFQGVHVPERIRYISNVSEVESKADSLTIDQHNDKDDGNDNELGNYTLLSHYLGMPANYRLTATVERIMLPFRHRLARVVAFVLIDPVLNTTLKGYKKNADGTEADKEDPTTTSIRFCNVKVLQGVEDKAEEGVEGGGHHTLTPTWTVARKVIPHFDGEHGSYSYKSLESFDDNFKFYTKEENGKSDDLYPTSTNWKKVHDATPDDKGLHNGYTEVNYGKVPVYDIIVRPTYSASGNMTSEDNVMYDEKDYATQKQQLANQTNKIDFELELTNGLRYEKTFEFDLNANYQTVVYLRISREHVDYNAAGSDIWIEEKNYDGWYGTDNENGNTLSYAGSSWQRAYTFGTEMSENHTDANSSGGVTDGHFYNASSSAEEQEKAQYFTEANKDIWVKKFAQAYKGGKHHGDYFILTSNITIDAGDLPVDFVFTGHLDAQDHTITLTGTNEWKASTIDPLNKLKAKTGSAGTDEDYTDIPQLFWIKQIAQSKSGGVTEIPAGEPIELDTTKTTPADITSDMLLFYKDSEGKFQLYTNRTFYKKTGASLFAGLNGDYTTAQESDSSLPANQWEANVHKEKNKGEYWVPTTGYRAEILNVKIASPATLFKDGASISGNVQNCWNGTTAISNNTPDIPKYK